MDVLEDTEDGQEGPFPLGRDRARGKKAVLCVVLSQFTSYRS